MKKYREIVLIEPNNLQTLIIDSMQAVMKFHQPTNKDFQTALELLRELHDHQNGPPLARYEDEYNETMKRVQDFLNTHEK